ncbi:MULTISPECIES: protein kinase family protein [Pasteurellaceae]|uniref:protein kinase family protein n=1 Tax=Pasteurellaceae TaxID=712 RepID=UPI00356AC75D
MLTSEQQAFEHYVRQLLQKYHGKRILPFSYEGKAFWLKQPEQVRGIWRVLKPYPRKAFRQEIAALRYFAEHRAPVPEMVLCGEDFFVLRDSGRSIGSALNDETVPQALKDQMLDDGARALAQLHRQGLVHGRPALRDMLWDNGRVSFIDFESGWVKTDSDKVLIRRKVRDNLIFIHSLGRTAGLSDERMLTLLERYFEDCEPQIKRATFATVHRYRGLYTILRPFSAVAKTDLIAIYRLFETMRKLAHQEAIK